MMRLALAAALLAAASAQADAQGNNGEPSFNNSVLRIAVRSASAA